MKHQRTMKVALVLALTLCTIMSYLVTVQTLWLYAQVNLSQVFNQTGNWTDNQTGNLSLSPTIPGQQGGTPPG